MKKFDYETALLVLWIVVTMLSGMIGLYDLAVITMFMGMIAIMSESEIRNFIKRAAKK